MLPLPPYLTSTAASATAPRSAFLASLAESSATYQGHPTMDHQHPTGARNVVRPEPRLPDQAQLPSPQHHHQQQQHHHHHLLQQQSQSHDHQRYQPSSSSHSRQHLHQQHQSLMGGGSAIGRMAVEGGYHLDAHSHLYRTQVVSGLSMPSHYQHPSSISLGDSSGVGPGPGQETSSPTDDVTKLAGKRRPRKRPKTCGVCGDRAKSFHFGGLSCDSCKAFFRRSVQHDAHLAFRCAYDGCCDINISTRKSCQYCRFQKCLSIGMEKSWVMTEEERNALNQQRLEKKQSKSTTATATATATSQQLPSPQPPPSSQPTTVAAETATSSLPSTASAEPTYTFKGSTTPAVASSNEPAALALHESEYIADVDEMLDYMSYEEQLEIKSVVETYLHAYKEMPFRVSLQEGRRDTLEIIEMFTTILRRFAYFSKLIPDFADLDRSDQGNLLKASVLEMCLLRGAVCFDTETNRWPNSSMESLKDCPQLRVEDMQRLVSRELFEMHITFIFHMKRLRIDEPIAMLLIMTVLFSPERIPVNNLAKIGRSQERYLMLLKKYVNWKFGHAAGSRIYPQLLTKLSDLRQLNDFHTEFHLNLDRQEVNAIRKSLMELHLNPYPNWEIVPGSKQSSPEASRANSPEIPAPSPSVEAATNLPAVTQALIRSFSDRRIPILLENPYATFETDLGMIRQVQQTLGSLFPTAASSQSAYSTANTHQSLGGQQNPNTEGETSSSASRNYSQHDPLLSSDKGLGQGSGSTSMSPKGYASSDSVDVQSLELPQSSRSHEFPDPILRDTITLPTATNFEDPLNSLLSGEYHSERLHQFLRHSQSGSGLEEAGLIRGLAGPSSSSSSPTTPSTSSSPLALVSRSHQQSTNQTVLRKHTSSSRSSPTAAPSSVIRSAHPTHSTPSSPSHSSTGIIQEDFAGEGNTSGAKSGSQTFRSVSCSTLGSSSTGWHGGEVHATTNGHRPVVPAMAITVTSRIQPPPAFSSDDDDEPN